MTDSEMLRNLLNTMSLDSIQDVVKDAGDNTIWRPFLQEKEELDNFNRYLQAIEESKTWPKVRNKEKGDLLENLMKFVFSRFSIVFSFERAITTDNEIDLKIIFNEVLSKPFIQKLGSYFICECKNMVSSTINVGMVTKLVELCTHDKAGLGIFVSIRGISGRGWKYAEGKRRKLFLSQGIPIISFTLEEIKTLSNPGSNFYNMIQKKYRLLVDEVDYDGESLETVSKEDADFSQVLVDTVESLRKIDLLTENEHKNILERINKNYII